MTYNEYIDGLGSMTPVLDTSRWSRYETEKDVQEYVDMYGYGNPADGTIRGKQIKVLPLAHPRQIGALGAHSERWHKAHAEWEQARTF